MGGAEKWGLYLVTIHKIHPDFVSNLTPEDASGLYHSTRTPEDQKKLAAATAITDSDLAGARAARAALRTAKNKH